MAVINTELNHITMKTIKYIKERYRTGYSLCAYYIYLYIYI